ncbi:MAG: FAD-dependent oxidoreductase [Fidelibacterota bacterium]|nr:MAG: FAD-dependent oxidoreductase [Candidatus Neomarinimicrobiota bacterium]
MRSDDFVFEPLSIRGVHFRNPFYVASGPTTRNLKQLMRAEECGWGGASIKLTIGPEPYINRKPRYGWFANQGIFAFTAEKRLTPDEGLRLVEEARKHTSELIIMANITYAGEKEVEEGWGGLARQFENAGAHVIELNMCCPNMSYNVEVSKEHKNGMPKTGASLGQDAEAVSHITRVVAENVSIPVMVKLTPEGGRIAQVAEACFEAGSDAVGGTANRLAIPPFDIHHPGTSPFALQRELSLSCFSGEFIKPLALRDVFEIRKQVGSEPIITATGGIRNFEDVIRMTFLGASLYGICTETILSGYGFLAKIINDLREYLSEVGYASLDDFRGSLVDGIRSAETVTLSEGHAQVRDISLAAPCVVACPNHVPAQGYVVAVASGDIRKAYDLLTASSPLQSVCGYVCSHPCESACIRTDVDEAISIREIKRFVLEYGRQREWTPNWQNSQSHDHKIAVVGAGPAGLSAAYYLQLAGYSVTVFEKEHKAGGLLRYGIPRFRLPLEALDREIDLIEQLGVIIKTDHHLPRDFTISQLRDDGYKAIILAMGAQASMPLNVPGENSEGCCTAIDFLDKIQRGENPEIGERVVVIGGGYSAVDVARICVRLGAREVYIAYRRTRDEMPASAEDIDAAEAEGVKLMYLVAPKEIIADGDGKTDSVRFVNCILGESDASDRRPPIEVEGTEFGLKVDTVIAALGQKLEDVADPEWSRVYRQGFLRVASDTFQTNLPDVYAVGDAVLGASDIISAIASGKRAAAAVDNSISGEKASLGSIPELNTVERNFVLERKGNVKRAPAIRSSAVPPPDRIGNSHICTQAYTYEEAVVEARRCLNCGCGEGCLLCVDICSSFAISNVGGKPWINEEECVGCGVCVWQCPCDNLAMIPLET